MSEYAPPQLPAQELVAQALPLEAITGLNKQRTFLRPLIAGASTSLALLYTGSGSGISTSEYAPELASPLNEEILAASGGLLVFGAYATYFALKRRGDRIDYQQALEKQGAAPYEVLENGIYEILPVKQKRKGPVTEKHLLWRQCMDDEGQPITNDIRGLTAALCKKAIETGCNKVVIEADKIEEFTCKGVVATHTVGKYIVNKLKYDWIPSLLPLTKKELRKLRLAEIDPYTFAIETDPVALEPLQDLLQRLEKLQPNSPIVAFAKKASLGDVHHREALSKRLRSSLSLELLNAEREQIRGENGELLGHTKQYTAGILAEDGMSAKILKSGVPIATETNVAHLFGLDEKTIIEICNNPNTTFAINKQIKALQLLMVRSLHALQTSDTIAEYIPYEGDLRYPRMIGEALVESAAGHLSKRILRRPEMLHANGTKVFTVPAIAFSAFSLTLPSLENRAEEGLMLAKRTIADEKNVETTSVTDEEAYAYMIENNLAPNAWVRFIQSKTIGLKTVNSTINYLEDQLGSGSGLSEADQLATALSASVGNVDPTLVNKELFTVESYGNMDSSGYWYTQMYSRLNEDPKTHTLEWQGSNSLVFFDKDNVGIIRADELKNYEVPHAVDRSVTNYLRVTAESPMTNNYSVPLPEDERFYVALRVPVLDGTKITAVQSPHNTDFRFAVSYDINGIAVIVALDQEYRGEPLTYILEKDQTPSKKMPFGGAQYWYGDQDKTSAARELATSIWQQQNNPENADDNAAMNTIIENVQSGRYSLQPISEQRTADGVSLEDVLAQRLKMV